MEIFRALHDLAQGARPPPVSRPLRPIGVTKSTNLWRDLRRGQIVSVTNLLISAGWKPNDAVKWVARETALRGILDVGGKSPKPRRITSELVSEWRAEASARTAPEATQFVSDRREEHAAITNRETAEHRARELLDNLRRTEFPESPPDNGNEN
jgi:hypothetical protein